jgi:hypothetical protein
MGKYMLNKETQKIELHFTKSEYQSLNDGLKSEIRSAFLWSGKADAWVSRSTNSHYRAEQVAKKLGLENAGSVGERLSYSEELERKTERAEARAERYEEYSDNALNRMDALQADFNKYRKDWSWLTQPIIAGHAGSRAFANHRNKVMARYDRGFEEYKKSQYYKDKAETARATASNAKLNDKVYLGNKIKESNKSLKESQGYIVKYEEALYKIQQGETLKNRSGEVLTTDYIEQKITDLLEKYEWEQDKLEFFEDCLSQLGGIGYSKENVKKGDMVKIRGSWGKVLSANPTTVRILNSLGWDWMKYPYSEIQEHKVAQ